MTSDPIVPCELIKLEQNLKSQAIFETFQTWLLVETINLSEQGMLN